MLYFMKPLPEASIDTTGWKPFIKNQWFRDNFMYFVYCLQIVLLTSSILFGIWHPLNIMMKVFLCAFTYIIHELLHIAVIYKAGDMSVTHSGIFLWITSGAVLGKFRFFVFMSLPFICLTIIPAVLHIFLSEELRNMAVYMSWINAIIAGSDLINSVLILVKPNTSIFYRGYYCEKYRTLS